MKTKTVAGDRVGEAGVEIHIEIFWGKKRRGDRTCPAVSAYRRSIGFRKCFAANAETITRRYVF